MKHTANRLTLVIALMAALALPYAVNAVTRDSACDRRRRTCCGTAEAIRAVKTLQRSFAQYGQYGLWNEMAGLFTTDASYVWGDDKATGAMAIGQLLATKYGEGKQGLVSGAVHAPAD